MPTALLPERLPVDAAPSWILQARAARFDAADATPVRALEGDWDSYTPRHGRNVALQAANVDLAAVRDGWEFAAVLRSEVLISGSRGAWDVVHAYKQRLTPADGAEFSVQAEETGVVWAGVRGARTWPLGSAASPALQLTGAVTLLSVQRSQRLDASGRVRYDAAAGYGFDARTLRQDSDRHFGGYGRQGAIGSGFAADLGLLWQPTVSSFLSLSVVDLVARQRIQDVSTEQATLTSSTRSRDAQGYLAYQPLLVGRYSSSDLHLTPSRKWSASVGARVAWAGGGDAFVGARWQRVAGLDLPGLWLSWPLTQELRLQLDGETRFRSLGVGLAFSHGALMLRTSTLSPGRSHALGWSAAFTMPM